MSFWGYVLWGGLIFLGIHLIACVICYYSMREHD